MRTPRCPRCGFGFAWDGRRCAHCPSPSRARQLWEEISRFTELVNAAKGIPAAQLLAIAAGCLRRAWGVLPESARGIVSALERGAGPAELVAAVRAVGNDPELMPPAVHPVQAIGTSLANGTPADLVRAVQATAAECARVIGSHQFPHRHWGSFPLAPELEPYRAAATELHRATREEQHALLNSRSTDPVRLAFEQLSRDAGEYNAQRWRAVQVEEAAQCGVCRDILGYPEVTVVFDAQWLTSTVVALAREMTSSGDFSAMPILADALQDAGCEEPEILEHCRADRPHYRGCWVASAVPAGS